MEPWNEYAEASGPAVATVPEEAPWKSYDAPARAEPEPGPWTAYDRPAAVPAAAAPPDGGRFLPDEPIYGEPGGETLTASESEAIANEAERAFPVQTPGRITTQPRTVREWAAFMGGGMLHPIRQAETFVEQTAIQHGLAQPGSRLLWSPADAMERPAFGNIPAVPQQKSVPAQLGAGAVNTLSGFLNFLQTPEGVAGLGLGKLPAPARTAIVADWGTQMLTSSPQELLAGAEAWKRGEYQEATTRLLSGAAGAVLGQTLLKHGLTPPATPVMLGGRFLPEEPAAATETEASTPAGPPSEFGGLPAAPAPTPSETGIPVSQPAPEPAPNVPPVREPWQMRKAEGDRYLDENMINAVKTDKGRVIAKNMEHGDLMPMLEESGSTFKNPNARGWALVGRKPSESYIGVADLEPAKADFHKAWVMKALREGKPVPQEVLLDYPDLKAVSQPAPDPSPLSTIESKYLASDVRDRRPVPAELVDRAQALGPYPLPEGYERQGDNFVFKEPVKPETETARMAREAREAMADLRARKEATARAEAESGVRSQEPAPAPEAERPREAQPEADPEMQAAERKAPMAERPPDILDWIESNYPGGVRPTSREDFGDYVRNARGAAKELLSHTKGERADQVIEEMHAQGWYRRITSEDQLLQAMTDAGEARIGWRQRTESWADATIKEGQKRLHAGLDPELLAAYAVKGAMVLGRGVRDFAEWSKEMLTSFGEAIRPHLQTIYAASQAGIRGQESGVSTDSRLLSPDSSPNERQRVQTIQASPDICPSVKSGTAADLTYTPRSHEQLQNEAQSIISARGPDAALQLFQRGPDVLPGDTRAALGAALERAFRGEEATARAAGNELAANAAADKQIALWKADAYGTEIAQALSARQLYDGLSPSAKLRQAQDMFDQAGAGTMKGLGPHLDTIKNELRQGQADAIDQVKSDPETNAAARQAVDETIKNSQETHHAVVMELAEPFASSKAILENARAVVRAKADELLNKNPRPPGFTAPQNLRQILDDLAARAATIASGHYQGAEPGIVLKDKFVQRLGLSPEAATRLAKSMDMQWQVMMKKAKDKLSQRVANQRARQQGGLNADTTDFAVDQAIRKQLAEHNLRLGQLVTEHAATVSEARESIGARLVRDSGLTGDAATKLQETFDRRFTALVDQASRARLKALDTSAAPPPKKLRSMANDLVQLNRLGAFKDDTFTDLIKRKLKLPTMTPEISRELVRRANDLEKLPEGFLRDRASTQLLNWVTKQAKPLWPDIPMGIFYNQILSGLTTPAKIIFENSNLLASTIGVSLLRGKIRPGDVVQAFGRGLVKGGMQSAEVLRSGIVTGVREGVHQSSVMELKPFGAKGEFLNYFKWIGRAISAEHLLTFSPAWEMKQSMVAHEVARTEGLRGQAALRRATELLSNTADRIEAAKVQARNELAALSNTSKLDLQRRALEIIEQNRETNMPGSTALARDFALRTTYLNKPYGFLGAIGEGIRTFIGGLRSNFPILGRAVQSQVPFTTVITNIFNEKLNWTPVGALRAVLSLKSGVLYGRPVMERSEMGDLLTKSIVGTIAASTLATLYGDYIHGVGPASTQQRKQLQAAGWIPNSIGPIGDKGRYISFLNTPAAAWLAFIGNWKDWHRYDKGDAADGEVAAVFALKGLGDVALDQGSLAGVKGLLECFGNENRAEGSAALERNLARTAGSFALPNLLRQVDKIFDPTVYDSTGLKAALQSQVPWYRRDGQPVLNALGEPLQRGPFDSWTTPATQDPVWRTIAERHLWIPEIPKDVIVGDKKLGPGNFRTLTPDERYRYAAVVGRDLRIRLAGQLGSLNTLPPLQAQHLLHEIVHEVHAAHLPSF